MLILHYLCCFTHMHSNKAKQKEKEKIRLIFYPTDNMLGGGFRLKCRKKA